MRLLFAVLVVFTIASASFADDVQDSSDAASLIIDAGRLVAMVDQSEEALALLAPLGASQTGPAETKLDTYAFYELVSVISRYNLLVVQACNAHVVDAKFCMEYRPDWLKEDPNAGHGAAELRTMIDDATAHIEPFWSRLCAKARPLAKGEDFCRME